MRRADKGAGEECCAFEKKAVMKDLELPGAFEPPLEGITVAASGLSRGSKKKKGFWPKDILSGYSLGPKIPLQVGPQNTCHTHTQSSTEQSKSFVQSSLPPPPPGTSNPRLTPGVGAVGVGGNFYRPLRVESETGRAAKPGEAFSLPA